MNGRLNMASGGRSNSTRWLLKSIATRRNARSSDMPRISAGSSARPSVWNGRESAIVRRDLARAVARVAGAA